LFELVFSKIHQNQTPKSSHPLSFYFLSKPTGPTFFSDPSRKPGCQLCFSPIPSAQFAIPWRRPSSLSRGPSFPSPGPARPISRPSLPLSFWPSSPSPPSFLSVTAWLVRCVLHRGPTHSHATSPLRALPHPPAWPWCPRACAPCLTYCMHLRTARTLVPP
jgi:hypothetical protein